MRQKSLFLLGASALLFLAACNMPGGTDPGAVFTAAAETVSAQFTANAQLTPSSTNTPLPSATLAATNTPAVSNTPAVVNTTSGGGGSGCDAMGFVSDVTVPDGADFAPDAEFTKTWRLKNTGTCSWSTSYSLVFSSGNSMSGPANQALSASVAPNSTVDISVDLKAPSGQGTYTGYWALRNSSGQNFGSFYVIIDVTAGGGSSGGTTVTIHGDEVGSVRSNGATNPNPNTGDIDAATSSQAFVSFDISGIPSNATITEVEVDFSDFDMLSTPFDDLGCLRAYSGNFFPLDAADYFGGAPSGAYLRWCDDNELSTVFIDDDMLNLLQSVVGDPTLQLRLQFNEHATDGDGTADMVRFGSFTLNVTYTEP